MLKYHQAGNCVITELNDETLVISSAQDAIELISTAGSADCTGIILREKNFHPDFFRLHTGLAGEILQKFSNYNFKLAITGDFTKYTSKSLQDFIRECNRGRMICFVDGPESAIKILSEK